MKRSSQSLKAPLHNFPKSHTNKKARDQNPMWLPTSEHRQSQSCREHGHACGRCRDTLRQTPNPSRKRGGGYFSARRSTVGGTLARSNGLWQASIESSATEPRHLRTRWDDGTRNQLQVEPWGLAHVRQACVRPQAPRWTAAQTALQPLPNAAGTNCVEGTHKTNSSIKHATRQDETKIPDLLNTILEEPERTALVKRARGRGSGCTSW